MKKIYTSLSKKINSKIIFDIEVKVEWFDIQKGDNIINWIYKFRITIHFDISYMDLIKDFSIKQLSRKNKYTSKFIKDEIYNKLLLWHLDELDDSYIYLWD